jgi:hypothetical protein
MSVIALDLSHPERVARELTEAQQRLALERELPDSVRGLVLEVAEAVAQLDDAATAGVDPYLVIALQRAVLAARNALDAADPAAERRRARVALEQLRHVFGEIAAGQPVAEDRPAAELARWLLAITGVPQHRLAELVGVGDRTWQRWVSTADPAQPTGADARRLRIVARIANHLRHTLTGAGVVGWFGRPRDELGGRSPAELLDEPDAVARLTALAAGTRASGAT